MSLAWFSRSLARSTEAFHAGLVCTAGSTIVTFSGITLIAVVAALNRVLTVPQAWQVCLSASAAGSGVGCFAGPAVTVTVAAVPGVAARGVLAVAAMTTSVVITPPISAPTPAA